MHCLSLEPHETNLLQAVSSARLLTLHASFENSARESLLLYSNEKVGKPDVAKGENQRR